MNYKLLPLKNHLKLPFNRTGLAINYLPKNSIGAELGVWKGEYSKTLYYNVHPTKLYLIDAWKNFPIFYNTENKKWYDSKTTSTPQNELDSIYKDVVEHFKDNKQVNIIREFTQNASNYIPDESLDWVYIDADHTYESCLSDLKIYSKKVKPGGLICGHDFSHEKELVVFGVNRAVEEFLKFSNYKFIGVTEEKQWGSYIIKKLK